MKGLDNSLDTGVLTRDSVGDWAQTSVCQLPSRIVANLGFTSHQSAKTISIVAIAFHLAAALPFLSDQTDTNCTFDDHILLQVTLIRKNYRFKKGDYPANNFKL